MYGCQAMVAVLLFNMLIAMMAKTFDNVAEAQEVNCMFLFAQTASEWRKNPRAPPSMELLSLPWELLTLPIWLESWVTPQLQDAMSETRAHLRPCSQCQHETDGRTSLK